MVIVLDRMVVSVRLKEQLMGNDHTKGLPLLSRTTTSGKTRSLPVSLHPGHS